MMSFWSFLIAIVCLTSGGLIVGAPNMMARLYCAFPRSKIAGYLLSTIAWIWAGYALGSMGLDFLEPYKRYLPVAVLVCTPLSWFWLDNLLSCRALGGVLTLFPYELLHVARKDASSWRLVLVVVAYVCIVKGMILLLYPWKLRQAAQWLAAHQVVFRLCGAVKLAVGILLAVLGATVFR